MSKEPVIFEARVEAVRAAASAARLAEEHGISASDAAQQHNAVLFAGKAAALKVEGIPHDSMLYPAPVHQAR